MPVLTSLFAHPVPPGLVLASCQNPGQWNKQCLWKKKCPCMFNYNRTLSFSLPLVLSIELSSERRCLLATVHYCRLFEVWQEKKKVLIFKVLAAIPSHTHTHLHICTRVSSAQSSPDLGFTIKYNVCVVVLMHELQKHLTLSMFCNPGGKMNPVQFCRHCSILRW